MSQKEIEEVLIAQPPGEAALDWFGEAAGTGILGDKCLNRGHETQLLRARDENEQTDEANRNKKRKDLSGGKPSTTNPNLGHSSALLSKTAREGLDVHDIACSGELRGEIRVRV